MNQLLYLVRLKNLKRTFLFLFFFFLLSSCTSLDRKIDKLPVQASKSKVLVRLGDPYKITRKQGKDHWSYRNHHSWSALHKRCDFQRWEALPGLRLCSLPPH